MTHGEKAKAKKGKSSQASVRKTSSKSSSQTAKSREASSKTGGKASQSEKTGEKQQASQEGRKKTAPADKKSGAEARQQAAASGDLKAKNSASTGTSDFSNAIVGAAFKRAIKKYPNAFRKLTD